MSVAVYERDMSVGFRGQGYRIGIKDAGSDALRDCLPADLYDLCIATSIATATRMVFMDHRLNVSKAWPITHGGSGFGVNRLTLREVLLTGLDDIVHFGANFERYTQEADGRIRAHFADGTSAVGDLLVGADGTIGPRRARPLHLRPDTIRRRRPGRPHRHVQPDDRLRGGQYVGRDLPQTRHRAASH